MVGRKKSSGDLVLRLVFDGESHGDIRFCSFGRRYTVFNQTPRMAWAPPVLSTLFTTRRREGTRLRGGVTDASKVTGVSAGLVGRGRARGHRASRVEAIFGARELAGRRPRRPPGALRRAVCGRDGATGGLHRLSWGSLGCCGPVRSHRAARRVCRGAEARESRAPSRVGPARGLSRGGARLGRGWRLPESGWSSPEMG